MIILVVGTERSAVEKTITGILGQTYQRFEGEAPLVAAVATTDLFGGSSSGVRLNNLLYKYSIADLTALHTAAVTIVFWQEKLDPAKKEYASWLKKNQVRVITNAAVSMAEAADYVQNLAETYKVKLNSNAVQAIVQALSPEVPQWLRSKAVFNTQLAEREIEKLALYNKNHEITPAVIQQLVGEPSIGVVFDFVQAVIAQQKSQAMRLFQECLATDTESEKVTIQLQMVSMLTEQLRQLWLARSVIDGKSTQAQVLKVTGWKPGRLSILQGHAQLTTNQKITALLRKLEDLEDELKSSTLPGDTVLALIVTEFLS